MRALFQGSGRIPVDSDKLNSLVMDGVIDVATDFNILADMPSGPVDLEVSRLDIRSKTSSSLHNRSAGKSSGHSKEG